MGGVLNFDEVRQAGVFAWRDDHYLFADGCLLRVHVRAPGAIQVTLSSLREADSRLFESGWHHLVGCRCRFCCPPASEGECWSEDDERARAEASDPMDAENHGVMG